MKQPFFILFFTFLSVAVYGQEVCDNEKDDDGDGLIDLFDDDCDCDDSAYQARCEIECDYLPESDFSIKYKWVSLDVPNENIFFTPPVVGDLNNDGVSEIVTLKERKLNTGSDLYEIYVVIFDSKTGQEVNRWFHSSQTGYSLIGGLCLADTDRDGVPEIFVSTRDADVSCYSVTGDVIWKTSLVLNKYLMPNIADFNCDGIPELYLGNTILNAQTGDLLLEDPIDYSSCTVFCYVSHSIAADLRDSPGLELAAGNKVYEVQINNTTGTVGNTFTAFETPGVSSGLTSIGDVDGDGLLEVVVNRGVGDSNGGLWVYNPRTLQIMATGPAFSSGSIPFIGDVNGDCLTDIGVVYTESIKMYSYNGTGTLSLLWNKTTTDQSGFTGISMFDFDQDGKNEMVYRDESTLRILNGENGDEYVSIPIRSTTWHEYPVIADVDGDREAEIVVTGNTQNGVDDQLFVFESADLPWAPARPLWNQIGYHVTNVNDDLTIPRVPQNQAIFLDTDDCLLPTCSQPYNSFLTQATYRTQKGCVQFPVVDLEPTVVSAICTDAGLQVCITIENLSPDRDFEGLLDISFFDDDPSMVSNLLITVDTLLDIGIASETDELCFTVPYSLDKNEVYVVVNADVSSGDPLTFPTNGNVECDYTNNEDYKFILTIEGTFDIGPDQFFCNGEDVTLDAGADYLTYLWSTGSVSQSITVTDPGTYTVEVTDFCSSIYRDTVEVAEGADVDLILVGAIDICGIGSTYISIDQSLNAENITWSPAAILSCTDCMTTFAQPVETTTVTVIADVGGCTFTDSVLVSVSEELSDTLNITSCAGDSLLVGDLWYYTSDTFSVDLVSQGGCDSSLYIRYVVRDSIYSYFDSTLCSGDSIIINGNTYNQSGFYKESISLPMSCDSIVEFDLTVYDIMPTYIIEDICDGEIYMLDNTDYTVTTMDTILLQGNYGCDSIVYLDLTVNDTYEVTDQIEFCAGDSVQIDGLWFTETGFYTSDELTVSNCDSIITFEITELPYDEVTIDTTICEGDSLWLYDRFVSITGLYIDTVFLNGCNTVVETDLQTIPSMVVNDFAMACPGDTVYLENNPVVESGIYERSFASDSGCDSVHIYEIVFIDGPAEPEVEFDCETGLTELSVLLPEGWNALWDNGSTEANTSYTDEDYASVLLTYSDICQLEYSVALSDVPVVDFETDFADTSVVSGTMVEYEIVLSDGWSVDWSTDADIDCYTCSSVNISPTNTSLVLVTFMHESGCSFESTFVIEIVTDYEIDVPNVFSPNGDGANDEWTIHLRNIGEASIEIYDRWGNNVARDSGTEYLSWDGMFNGVLVSSGVYIYVIRFDNVDTNQKVLVGDVTVLR